MKNLKVLIEEIYKYLPVDDNCKITLCPDIKNPNYESLLSNCTNIKDRKELFVFYVVYLKEKGKETTYYNENNILFMDIDVVNKKGNLLDKIRCGCRDQENYLEKFLKKFLKKIKRNTIIIHDTFVLIFTL